MNGYDVIADRFNKISKMHEIIQAVERGEATHIYSFDRKGDKIEYPLPSPICDMIAKMFVNYIKDFNEEIKEKMQTLKEYT